MSSPPNSTIAYQHGAGTRPAPRSVRAYHIFSSTSTPSPTPMGTSFTMTTGCCRCGRPVARRFLSLADKPSGAFEDVDVVPHAAAAAAAAVISRVPFVPAALGCDSVERVRQSACHASSFHKPHAVEARVIQGEHGGHALDGAEYPVPLGWGGLANLASSNARDLLAMPVSEHL